eukprot:514136-Prymnesium_polylepis.1
MKSMRWSEETLREFPSALRPHAGETLDLILRAKVLLLQSRRGYRANTDSMLLAYYAAARNAAAHAVPTSSTTAPLAPTAQPEHVAELGCGNGL